MNSTRSPVITGGLTPGALATAVLQDEQHVLQSALGRLEGGALTRAALGTRLDRAPRLFVPGLLRRAAVVAGDVMGIVAIVLCIPFVILAIGTPIALCLRLLLWIGGLH